MQDENLTPEQQNALKDLHAANLAAQEARAKREEAEAKRRMNRFSFTVRGFALSHHSGAETDIERAFKEFTDKLRTAGHDAHYSASHCGDVGHETPDEF